MTASPELRLLITALEQAPAPVQHHVALHARMLGGELAPGSALWIAAQAGLQSALVVLALQAGVYADGEQARERVARASAQLGGLLAVWQPTRR